MWNGIESVDAAISGGVDAWDATPQCAGSCFGSIAVMMIWSGSTARPRRFGSSAHAINFCMLSILVAACAPSANTSVPSGTSAEPSLASVPVGMQLAYATFRGGTTQLEVATTTASTPIATGEDWEAASHPAWSASGDEVVFIANDGGEPTLRMVTVADGAVLDLANVPPSAGSPLPLPFGQLSWSPSSGLVAFSSALGGSTDVWVATTDGTGRTSPLIGGLGAKSSPAWSPDGMRLAFSCQATTGVGTDICVVNSAGRDLVRLTSDQGDNDAPAWSPDGLWIAYAARLDCSEPIGCLRSRISVIAAGGGDPQTLTNGGDDDGHPSWSPDGQTLAFSRNDEIWLMTGDGLNQARLGMGMWPTWRP